MKIAEYRNFLVKIKEDFQSCLHSRKKESLSVEEVSQLLYRHIRDQPFMVKDLLLKGTGKLNIKWDELLQYLQQEIQIREEVQKIEHCPPSATEIIQSHLTEFSKVVQYVKQKETNMIQSIKRLPVQIGGQDLFLISMDKEVVIFDFGNKQMLNSIQFRYSKMREKIFEKEEQRRIQKQKLIQNQAEEFLDKVVINQLNVDSEDRKKSSFGRMLTSNIKSSMRGSALSDDHSDKYFFRRQTQSNETKRRNKSHVIKIKNDDVSRVFKIFQNATINNSINVARAFTAARSNFQKHIVIDKSVLYEKEKPEKSYGMMSEVYQHNYYKELQEMRNTNYDLTKMRKSLINQGKCYKPTRRFSENSLAEVSSKKLRKNSNAQPITTDNNVLQIVDISIVSNYLLVSFFNRQIRLLQMKRGLISIKVQTIFEKQFKSVVTYVDLVRSKEKQYRILVVLDQNNKYHSQDMKKSLLPVEESGLSEVHLYQLDQQMMITNKIFENQVDFSAKYQSALPYGVILFNEKGNFCFMELNSSGNNIYQVTLNNPETGFKVSTNQVRVHKNLLSFFLCCSNGYIYLFDRLSKKIKYYTKASPSPVLDIRLIKQDSQIIALYQNGNMVILSALHLEKIFFYQSYHQVSHDSKILTVDATNLVIYNYRSFKAYCLCQNQERLFNNIKPLKILKNRSKLRTTSQPKPKEKSKVYKIINGRGGLGDFLCILFQQGEICFIDTELKYLGSYYCLKVTSIIDVTCNENHQFICLLYDDNTLEVINLYTQTLLFPVVLQEKQVRSRKQSVTSITLEKKKNPKKIKENIILMNFFSQEIPNLFLGLITQRNNVYHLSEKGVILSVVNLERSCRDGLEYSQLIYEGQSLVLLTGQSLTVLYRQSYTKKCVIYVSEHKLVSIRKTIKDGSPQLLCLDKVWNVFLVNTNLKKIVKICSFYDKVNVQICLFNYFILLKHDQQHSRVKLIEQNKETMIRTDSRMHYLSLMNKNILQISKQTGKVLKFNFKDEMFQQFFY